jgi:uncharacterized protein
MSDMERFVRIRSAFRPAWVWLFAAWLFAGWIGVGHAGYDPDTDPNRTLENKAHQLMEQTPPDWDGARILFERAARNGSLRASTYVGWMYENGHGVTRDHVVAARWYADAADGGVHEFALKLGWMYLGNSQLDPDRERAERWFAKAIDGGHYPANIALASVLIADALGGKGVERVFEARALLEIALEEDHALAAFFLARLYVEGIGGHPVDEDLGATYTRISAEDGQALMQGWLASMYLEGRGVPRDQLEAAFWAALSASGGDQLGQRLHHSLTEALSDDAHSQVMERAMRWRIVNETGARHQ